MNEKEIRLRYAVQETVNGWLAEKLGRIMFKWHDTHGLSVNLMEDRVQEFLDSPQTKSWFDITCQRLLKEAKMAEGIA